MSHTGSTETLPLSSENEQSLVVRSGVVASSSVSNRDNSSGSVVLMGSLNSLHLIAQLDQTAQALVTLGITEVDLLSEIPHARAELMVEVYSPEFLSRLDHAWLAAHPEERNG